MVDNLEAGGVADAARLSAALEELSSRPRPPEFRPVAAAGPAGAAVKTSAHRFASAGDAAPPQTIVKGSGFPIRFATVWLVFWGSEWTSATPAVDPDALTAAVQTITHSDYIAYLQEYGVDSLDWGGAFFDAADPPATFFRGSVQNEVTKLISAGSLPKPNTGNYNDTLYCVMMPSTATYGPGGLSGEHSAASWTNPDDNHTYNPFVAWIGNGSLDGMTATFSHELAEALTDPEGTCIQLAPASPTSWNEICDVCASVAYLDGVAVSSYWSNLEQACVIPVNQFNSLFQEPPAGLALQVLAIQQAYSTEVGHQWIYAIRTRDPSTGIEYDLYRGQAASLIDAGTNTFYVIGADGSRSEVITRIAGDHSYVTTSPDASTQDNLLSLPTFS
jgi:hypothetical protein